MKLLFKIFSENDPAVHLPVSGLQLGPEPKYFSRAVKINALTLFKITSFIINLIKDSNTINPSAAANDCHRLWQRPSGSLLKRNFFLR